MKLLDLPVDVLLIVATFLSRKDLSLLSRTCHAFHDALVHQLLLSDFVWLNRRMFPSFCQFMRAGTGDRPTFLRDLRFNAFPSYYSIAHDDKMVQSFTTLLQSSHNLVSLSIHCITFGFLPDELRHALSPLRRLENLTLSDITAAYQDTLADVVSALRFVDLSSGSIEEDDEPTPVDPTPFLKYHRSTITSLVLAGFTLTAHGEPFSGVRRLRAYSFAHGRGTDETGWVGPLVHLFPNLERLDLQSLLTHGGTATIANLNPHDEDELLIARGWRLKGQTWQARHGTWTAGLRYLRTRSIVEVFCLGLSCHVSRLDVYTTLVPVGVTSAVLADLRPRCVWFPVTLNNAPDRLSVDFLQAAACTPSLTHMIIDVSEETSSIRSPTELVARLVVSFPRSSITHLYVHFEGDTRRAGKEPSSSAEALLAMYAQIPDVVWRVRRDIRALRWIFVGSEMHGVRGWERFRADEGGVEWKELDDSRVREMIKAEDMVRYDLDDW